MKIQCQKCHAIKPVPIFRWIAGTIFLLFAFGLGFYMLYSSLSVLWPLIVLPFIDYDTGVMTFALLGIPAYVGFAWIVGRVIK